MIKVGIIGGAGYTAGELIRILLNHPEVEINFVHSTSNYGNKLYDVHKDLLGETEMQFGDIDLSKVDVIFLCMGHGRSKEFIVNTEIPSILKIIDLSRDFRLKAPGNEFIYGLPELNKVKIVNSKYIANPGCFATGIELALLPLAKNQLIKNELHINGITGSTGAGQEPTATTHFSWRNNNISIYKAFNHQHLDETIETIKELQPDLKHDINFLPVRGNFARGILVSAYLDCDIDLTEALKLYNEFYKKQPFVFITSSNPDLKQVVNTNKCILYLEKHKNKLLIVSITDNLIKGASGQAVQNMNLMFGIDEKDGLNLKPIAF